MKKTICITLDSILLDDVKTYCKQTGISKSLIVEKLLTKFLQDTKNNDILLSQLFEYRKEV